MDYVEAGEIGGTMTATRTRKTIATLSAAILTLGLSAAVVDAKPGRGGSTGNRGAKTDMSVPSTPTAPRTSTPQAAPGATQPGRPAAPAAAAAAQAAKPSMMSTMAKGFAMGLIGAGLFGLLTGNGLFGGLSGLMGFLGLLLQVALIAIAIRLVWGFIQSRRQPQAVPAGAPNLARAGINQPQAAPVAQPAPQAYQPQPAEPQRTDAVGIGPDDYQAFQGVLVELMRAYAAEDLAGLRRVATPDVAAHYIRELHEAQSKGVVNRLSQPELLQGDLAESWYEDNVAYATVAMRFSMADAVIERQTGRVIEGDLQRPVESTEIWTFRRDGAGRPWLLCGQQQA
jgi:predicted lipid-binding transport protein (Tim44 family)